MADDIRTLPSGGSLDAQLSFLANTVVVDNGTNQYLYLGPSGRIINPYSHTVVVPLPSTEKATAKFITPPGIIAPPVKVGESATLHYISSGLPAASAQSTFSPPATQQVIDTQAANGAGFSSTVSVPTGTHVLAIIGKFSFGQIVSISGVQSGVVYTTFTPTVNRPIFVPIVSAVDTQVTWTSTASANTLFLVAIYDVEAIAVVSQNVGLVIPVSPSAVGAAGDSPPIAPVATNILAGSSNANGGTIITIPANRTWVGTVWTTGVGAAAGAATMDVHTAGATVTPAAGTLLVATDIGNATTSAVSNSASGVVVSAGTSSATLVAAIGANATAGTSGAAGVLY